MNKVRKGTPIHHEPTLCASCRFGTVVEGGGLNDGFTYCSHIEERVRVHVTACSRFNDRSQPSLYDLRLIAWELRTDKGGRRIGFISPQDLRKERSAKAGAPTETPPDQQEAPLYDPLKKEHVW